MNREGEFARVPCLGASGAISGVLGAYVVSHPDRKVHMLLLFRFVVTVPALVAIGVWFAMQMIGGFNSLEGEGGGVAYAAHIGGFVAGGVLIWLFMPSKDRKEFAGEQERDEGDVGGIV